MYGHRSISPRNAVLDLDGILRAASLSLALSAAVEAAPSGRRSRRRFARPNPLPLRRAGLYGQIRHTRNKSRNGRRLAEPVITFITSRPASGRTLFATAIAMGPSLLTEFFPAASLLSPSTTLTTSAWAAIIPKRRRRMPIASKPCTSTRSIPCCTGTGARKLSTQ